MTSPTGGHPNGWSGTAAGRARLQERRAPAETSQVTTPARATTAGPGRALPRVPVVVVGVLLGLVSSVLLLGPGEAFSVLVVDDLAQLVAAAFAAVTCGWCARRTEDRRRRAWGSLSAGCAAWAAGQAVWSWYELVLAVDTPFPSVADVGFLGFAAGRRPPCCSTRSPTPAVTAAAGCSTAWPSPPPSPSSPGAPPSARSSAARRRRCWPPSSPSPTRRPTWSPGPRRAAAQPPGAATGWRCRWSAAASAPSRCPTAPSSG